MLGELNDKEVDALLARQVTGRLGCCAANTPYIVPVNYIYRHGVIYAHSGPGKKLQIMRKNPVVCFEVDEIESIFRWKSAVIWGRFEEITDLDEKQQVMQGIIHTIMPLTHTPQGHPSHGIGKESDIGTKIDLIVYKIRVVKKSGRFEQD